MYTEILLKTTGIGALIAALALAGCGGSSPSATLTTNAASTPTGTTVSSSSSSTSPSATSTTAASEKGKLSLLSNAISSPNIVLSESVHASYPRIATAYTCDGSNTSPALHWANLPSGTAEIAVIVLHPGNNEFQFDWAVAGLKPSSHGLPAGSIPASVVAGRDSRGKLGYSVCPPKGPALNFGLLVVAFAHRLSLKPGFKAIALYEAAEREATAEGLLTFSYKRA
jgi:phosphatidylethanolamine-binding protein (PEBP) family uncharacterized protein